MKRYGWVLFCVLAGSVWSCGSDPCDDIECLNGGICEEGVCTCSPEFRGDRCEQPDLGLFLGNYTADYAGCLDVSPEREVLVEALNNISAVRLRGLGDYTCPGSDEIAVEALVTSPSSIRIETQTVCAANGFDGYTFTGQGTRRGDTLRISFRAVYTSSGSTRTDDCDVTLVRK